MIHYFDFAFHFFAMIEKSFIVQNQCLLALVTNVAYKIFLGRTEMRLIHSDFEEQCSENACEEVENPFSLRELTRSCLKQFLVTSF